MNHRTIEGSHDSGAGNGPCSTFPAQETSQNWGSGARPRMNCRGLFDSVRAGIGSALRSLHSDVLREPLPDGIAELLRQLDEQLRQLDQDTDKA